MKNRQHALETLHNQILDDSKDGDTTVLFEILGYLTDDEIYGFLSGTNQNKVT